MCATVEPEVKGVCIVRIKDVYDKKNTHLTNGYTLEVSYFIVALSV